MWRIETIMSVIQLQKCVTEVLTDTIVLSTVNKTLYGICYLLLSRVYSLHLYCQLLLKVGDEFCFRDWDSTWFTNYALPYILTAV